MRFLKILSLSVFCFLAACGSPMQKGSEILPQEATDDSSAATDTSPSPSPVITAPSPVGTLGAPATNARFSILPDGRKLSSISVNGSKLALAKGSGNTFGAAQLAQYLKLKNETQTESAHTVQWVFVDLDAHRVIEKSKGSNRRIFGASSSKIYVAATLLDRQNGNLKDSQLQLMANMLVVSSNEAWVELQSQIGEGSANLGRERIQAFTQKMGYLNMRGYQGTLGSMHGNELVADESAETLYDIYTNQFSGAEIEWKLMHTCRTGANRGRKYIPSSIYVGGKTGTYDGPTVNPETGGNYTVHIRNHILVFNVDGRQFGLVVFANSASDESAALIAGGLLREYTSID